MQKLRPIYQQSPDFIKAFIEYVLFCAVDCPLFVPRLLYPSLSLARIHIKCCCRALYVILWLI